MTIVRTLPIIPPPTWVLPLDWPAEFNRGDIVQIINPAHHWFMCLAIVDKDPDGRKVMRIVVIMPKDRDEQGRTTAGAWIRIEAKDILKVGTAALIPE